MLKDAVANIQQIIAEKIPADLIVAEHTDTAHFYRYQPLDELYKSVTKFTGILDAAYLKKWAARTAVEHIDKRFHEITMHTREMIYEEAVNAHDVYFRDAGEVGTQGHNVVEEYLLNWIEYRQKPESIKDFIVKQEDLDDPRVAAITRSAERFCTEYGIIPIASELLVANPRLKYAGTLDGLMMIPRRIKKGDGSCGKSCEYGDYHQHNYSDYNAEKLEQVCFTCNQKVRYELVLMDWKTSNSIKKAEYAMQVAAYKYALKELTGLDPKKAFIVRLDKKIAQYEVVSVANLPQAFAAFKNALQLHGFLYDDNGNQRQYLVPHITKEFIAVL